MSWLSRLTSFIHTSTLKVKMLIGLFAGALMTLALPPAFFYPGFVLGFLLSAYLVMACETKKHAFWTGWAVSFGFLLCSLYWISNALLVFSSDFWWMVPFAAVGLPSFLAIYAGLAGILTTYFTEKHSKILAWGLGWVLGEYLRGTLFTGFPWNLIGQSWGMSDALAQTAAYVGVYGMSLLAVASVTALVLIPLIHHKLLRICLAFIIATPLFAYGLGSYRLSTANQEQANTEHGMRLVQSGIPQREKWGRDYRRRNFELHLQLSTEKRPDWVKTIIWPETAAAFFLERDQRAREAIGYNLPSGGHLITGTIRREEAEDGGYRLYNSMVTLNDYGQVINSYDKSHLVPFGEYVPLKEWLPFDLKKVTQGAVDFSAGPGTRSINIEGLPPVSPLICYEVIFPSNVVNPFQPADWILNLTNDAWYGETAGPHQHLDITRMRAIEEGLPMIRAANTGISAVIDPYGRILDSLVLNEEGYMDFYLPKKLQEPTLFAQIGNGAFMGLLALWVVILLWQHDGFRRKLLITKTP